MSSLAEPVDHIKEGLAYTIAQYQGKPNFQKWCMSYLWQIQHIEDAIHASVEAWRLDNAVGWRLAVIGSIVGQPRIGGTEDIYRTYIKTKVLVNSSDGRHRTLSRIAEMLIPGFDCHELNQIRFYGVSNPDFTYEQMTVARNLLQEACRAGGHIELLWVPDETPFEFASSTGTEIDAPGGFDDSISSLDAGTFATVPGL